MPKPPLPGTTTMSSSRDAQAGGDRRVVDVAGDALDQRVDPGLADREPDRDLAGRRDAEPGQDLPAEPARLERLVHRSLHLGPRAEARRATTLTGRSGASSRTITHRLGHELLGPVADGALDLVRVEPADLHALDLDGGGRGVVVAGRAERRADAEHDGQQPEQARATRPAAARTAGVRARAGGGRGGGRRPRVGGRLRVASRMRRNARSQPIDDPRPRARDGRTFQRRAPDHRRGREGSHFVSHPTL